MRLWIGVMAVAVIAACVGPVVRPAVATADCQPSVGITGTSKVPEGTQMTFTVTRTPAQNCPADALVHYHTEKPPNSPFPATPGDDYDPTEGLVSVTPAAPQQIFVPILIDNDKMEREEAVQLCLDSVNGILACLPRSGQWT